MKPPVRREPDDFDKIIGVIIAERDTVLRRLAKWDTNTSPAPAVAAPSRDSTPTPPNESGCGG